MEPVQIEYNTVRKSLKEAPCCSDRRLVLTRLSLNYNRVKLMNIPCIKCTNCGTSFYSMIVLKTYWGSKNDMESKTIDNFDEAAELYLKSM